MPKHEISKLVLGLSLFLLLIIPFVSAQTQEESALALILKEIRDLKRITTNEIQNAVGNINSNTIKELDKREESLKNQMDSIKTALLFQLGIGVAVGLIIGTIIVQFIHIRLRKIREALELRRLQEQIKPFEQKKAQLEADIQRLTAELEALKDKLANSKPLNEAENPPFLANLPPEMQELLLRYKANMPPNKLPDLPIPSKKKSWFLWLLIIVGIILLAIAIYNVVMPR